MAKRTRVHPIAPFIFYGQDLPRTAAAGPLERRALRYAFCLWKQVDGTGRLVMGGGTWNLSPGDVAVTEPGAVLQLGYRSRGNLVAFALTGGPFSRGPGGNYLMDKRSPRQPSWHEIFGVDLRPKVARDPGAAGDLVDYICGNYWRSAANLLEANARLHLWIARYVRRLVRKDEGVDEVGDLCWQAERIIDRDLRSVTVESIARQLHVSRQHLSSVYARGTGRTVGAEIRRQRIEQAQGRLRGDEPIAEVARKVGYQSASAFAAAFAAMTGWTPRAWRRRQGEGAPAVG